MSAARTSMSIIAIRRAERFTAQDAERAEALLRQQEEALRAGDLRRLMPLTTEFHESLYAAAHSAWLYRSLQTTHESMQHYLGLILAGHPRIEVDYSGHRRVLEACIARDPDRAADELTRHLNVLVDFFGALLADRAASQDDGADAPAEPASNAPPSVPTLGDWATAELRERILSGELRPGEPLRLERLAALLGTGIFPAREALRELQRQGLVEHEPNRGARVAQVSPQDFLDLSETRLALEPIVLGHSALRFTDADDERARTWLSSLRPGSGGERTGRGAGVPAVHFALYDASAGPLMRVIRRGHAELYGAAHTDRAGLNALRRACADHDRDLAETLLATQLRRHAARRRTPRASSRGMISSRM